MKFKKIYIKNKIINHLILNGKKEISEDLLLKTLKELQKDSLKQSKTLVNLTIIRSIPVFRVYKMTKKKRKKKVKKVPVIISNKQIRISLSIKFILASLKTKTLNNFYRAFCKEMLSNIKNESLAIQMKNKIQKEALLKKHFFYYYRW